MALFSKRHYVYLESILRDEIRNLKMAKEPIEANTLLTLVKHLGLALKQDNPEFDYQRFHDAIYISIDKSSVGTKNF